MFAQFGEENIINAIFPADFIGNCIEIGAYDGIMCSNTKYYENKGWKTLVIEPNPIHYEKCLVTRNKALCYAVGDKNEDDVNFTIFNLEGNNESAISSLEVDQKLITSHLHLIKNVRNINVKVRTLDYILEEELPGFFDKIDYISIDTEGTELKVLKGFNILKWKPKLLLIENNHNDPDIEEYLKQFNYKKILRNHVNDFYLYNPV